MMDNVFAIKGDICYCQDKESLHTLQGGYLVCENGISAGVYAQLPMAYAGIPVHDYGHQLIIPGLVDLHVHAPQYAYRALGLDMELLDWLNANAFPEEAKFRDLAYADRAYGDFVEEMLHSPNTRACVFATVHKDATLLLMDKLEAAGLMTMVGKVNMDRNSFAALQEASAEASLAETRSWLDAANNRYTHTLPILTPRFIPSCSDVLMRGLGDIQKAYGVPVQSHLSENLSECEWVKALCPDADSYGDAYRRFGLFGGDAPTVMAHCVWSSPEEIALMQAQGVYVAHCPQSNMNVSSGIAPVRRFLDAGVHVGLGSDVAGGSHVSIFRAMTDAVQVSKLRWRLVDQADKPLSLIEAFYLATVGGGAFFGKVGSFDKGYALDAVVLDDTPLLAPYPLSIEDRLSRVAYLSDDRHIQAKYVQGRKLFGAATMGGDG